MVVKLLEQAELEIADAEEAVEAATKLAAQRPDDPFSNYLAGYAWYSLGVTGNTRDDNVHQYLRKATLLNPQYAYAQLYLGHHYFDLADYASALIHFKQVSIDQFNAVQRAWRAAKLEKLIICCKIWLEDLTVNEHEARSLVARIEMLSEDDKPVPEELAGALVNAGASLLPNTRNILMGILKNSEFFPELSVDFPQLLPPSEKSD